jgi:TM2 domain-containing membrane protein YozV
VNSVVQNNQIVIPKNPGVAAVLSFFFPGLGQIYNGQILIGIIMGIITLFLYLIVIGFVVHLYLIYDAYKTAVKYNNNISTDNYKINHVAQVQNMGSLNEDMVYKKIVSDISNADLTKSSFKLKNPSLALVKVALNDLSQTYTFKHLNSHPEVLIHKLLELNPELAMV